jgi:hypothetical protein
MIRLFALLPIYNLLDISGTVGDAYVLSRLKQIRPFSYKLGLIGP